MVEAEKSVIPSLRVLHEVIMVDKEKPLYKFTVKALISSWCEANSVPFPEPRQLDQLVSSPEGITAKSVPKLEMDMKPPAGQVVSEPIIGMVRASGATPSTPLEYTERDGLGGAVDTQEGGYGGDASGQENLGRSDVVSNACRPGTSPGALKGVASQRPSPLLDRRQTWGGACLVKGFESPRSPGSAVSMQSFDLPAVYDLSACKAGLPESLPRGISGNDTSASPASGPGTLSFSGPFRESMPASSSVYSGSGSGGGSSYSFGSGTCSEAVTVLPESWSGETRQPSLNSGNLGPNGSLDARPQEEDVPVLPLVEALRHGKPDEQRAAAERIRALAKFSMVNRTRIAAAGGIGPLVSLMRSPEPETVEQAVTALLNVSINEGNKGSIAASGAIELLVDVLQTGTNVAKENAAATLFSLSVMDENKITIGASGAIPPLVDLLINGSERGKKDACTALFNLSIYSGNRGEIVRAGAIKELVHLLTTTMVDKACAVLANMAAVSEGREAIVEEGGVPLLVEVLESGSSKGKENAVAALLHLSLSNQRHSRLVLHEGAIPPLVALSQAGTNRAREKAISLLKHFREQRQSGLIKHGSLQNKMHHVCK